MGTLKLEIPVRERKFRDMRDMRFIASWRRVVFLWMNSAQSRNVSDRC